MPAKKILCVDDSNTVLMLERLILQRAGYQLRTARDGEEAVRAATAERPDLILLDVVMPLMSGIDACRTLRQNPMTSSIPIILVTTRGEAESVEAGYGNGCTEYVLKPIDTEELLHKVRSCLGEEGAGR